MTQWYVRWVFSSIVAVVLAGGCGPQEKPVSVGAAKPPLKAAATVPVAASSPPVSPFVLPEQIARRIANELVVTTYLRGGPEHLTVDTDIVLADGITPTSDEFLGYGIGMPLLQWTYDGRRLRKADAWRAFVAHSGEWFAGQSFEHAIAYCTWKQIGNARPGSLGDCVRHVLRHGESGDDAYRHWTSRARIAVQHILERNHGTVDAIVSRLRIPHDRTAIATMSGGDAPVDECGVRQWQFGWYRDLLRAHPISYAPLRDAAPGKYPVAIDDGACPMPGPAHPSTFEELDTLGKETLRDMDVVFGPSLTRFVHLNGSPRLTHFLNVQFDPNDFRAIPQIDAVVTRRLRSEHGSN